jgi:hypothetical protein
VVVAGTLYYVRAAWGRGRPAPREGAYDSATYRGDSVDCGMALLAIQQGLGVLPERRPGADPDYFADPSSRRSAVALRLSLFFGSLPRRGRGFVDLAIQRFLPRNFICHHLRRAIVAEVACGLLAAGPWTVPVLFAGADTCIHAASRFLTRRSAPAMNCVGF